MLKAGLFTMGVVMASVSAQAGTIATYDGLYSPGLSSTPGYAAFATADITKSDPPSYAPNNSQGVNDSRDNAFTVSFTSQFNLGQVIFGQYGDITSAVSLTIRIYEVDDVSGDLSGVLGGANYADNAIFYDSFVIPTADFTSQSPVTGVDVGTVVFTFAAPVTLDATTGTAGYAIQFDIDSGSLSWAQPGGTNPPELHSYYRRTTSNYGQPLDTAINGQIALNAVPEPASLALVAMGGLLISKRRKT